MSFNTETPESTFTFSPTEAFHRIQKVLVMLDPVQGLTWSPGGSALIWTCWLQTPPADSSPPPGGVPVGKRWVSRPVRIRISWCFQEEPKNQTELWLNELGPRAASIWTNQVTSLLRKGRLGAHLWPLLHPAEPAEPAEPAGLDRLNNAALFSLQVLILLHGSMLWFEAETRVKHVILFHSRRLLTKCPKKFSPVS